MKSPFDQVAALEGDEAREYLNTLQAELAERSTEGYADSAAELCLLRQAIESVKGHDEEAQACLDALDAYEKRGVEVVSPSGDRPKIPAKGMGGLGYDTKETASVWGTPTKRRVQTFVVFIFNFFTGLPIFLGTFLFMFLIPPLWPFLFIYIVYTVIDCMKANTPRKYNHYFRNHPGWHYYAAYFPVRLRIPHNELFTKFHNDKAANYLLVVHPHGVHSFGALINFASNTNGLDERLPELFLSVQTLSIQFWLPIWREIVRVHSFGNASKTVLKKLLTGDPGDSALLVVGGAAEALDAAPGTSALILRKRKGFVRIALETGAALVPCFSFGENDTYRSANPSPETRSRLKWLQAKLGFAVPMVVGRGVFNYNFGTLPHRRTVTSVVGDPIRVEKWEGEWDINNPKLRAAVDELHEKYMNELQGLYDKYKNVYDLSRTDEISFAQ